MNQSNPMETGGNPEQQIREEMLHNIVAGSEGTVALYTSMDFKASDNPDGIDRNDLIATQAARRGAVAEKLYAPGGGWGDYGEREAVDPAGRADGESVDFVALGDGNVDVRYVFSQPGYKDATGRPGNALNMQFIVKSETAAQLKNALTADPSFVSQVLERQVQAIGIDPQSTTWQRLLKPNYYENFQLTVQDKDRILKLRDVDAAGTVSQEQALVYGENRSLLSLRTPEAPVSVVEQAPTIEQQDLGMSPEDFTTAVQERFASETEYAASLQVEGKSFDEIIALYADGIAEIQQILETHEGTTADFDSLSANKAANEKVVERLTEQKQKAADITEARGSLEIALQAAENTQSVQYNGQPVDVIERYNAANTEQTPWVVIRDAQNNEKHIKASELQ